MPRCFPPEPDFGEDRRAERTVWEALRDQLPDDAVLFYSVGLKERDQDYEADVVVAWPGVGVAVIEVKGGRIEHRDGQWWQGSAVDKHKIDPVTQVLDCVHVLHRFLQQRANPAAASRATYLVAFPHERIPGEFELPDLPRGLVIDKADLANASTVVRNAIDVFGTGQRALTPDDADRLVDSLERELTGQLSLLTAAEEHEQRVDQMTRDQLKILDYLRMFPSVKVLGGAGTGKTWLAVEQARRLSRSGKRVALVCYSRGLARFFQRLVATWPRGEQPAYVGLFHRLPLEWGADLPPENLDDVAAQSDYYEVRLPAQMGELAARQPDGARYDAIVVDEAQDFGEAWWPPTTACLRDPATGLFAFLDEAQRVFSRYGEVPIDLPPFSLGENIRNTKRIAQVFGSLSGEQLTYRGLDGPPVRFVQCATDDVIGAAEDAADWLLEHGWEPRDVAVLTTGRRHYIQTAKTEEEWAAYWDAFFDDDEVFYGHVLGFKGLERPAVVLAVNGLRDESRAKEMLYVGLSRARSQLVVVGDLEEIGRLGGDGVRKRLQKAQPLD
jgi:hypothetical protein